MAIAALKDQLTRTDLADIRARLKELETESGELIKAREDERKASLLTETELKKHKSAQKTYEAAKDTYERQALETVRRLRSARIGLDVKGDAKVRILDELLDEEKKLGERQKKLDAFEARGIPLVKKIETADAILSFEGDRESELAKTNELIAEQLAALRDTMKKRDAARKRVKQFERSVIEDANTLSNDVTLSYIGQALTQGAIQVVDNAYDSKGKGGSFIAGAISQMAVNLLNSPTFYDAKIDKYGKVTVDEKVSVGKLVRESAKSVSTTVARDFGEHVGLKAYRRSLLSSGRGLSDRLLKATLRRQLGDRLNDAIKAKAGGKSAKFGMVKSIVLDQVSEAAKGWVAAAMQEQALKTYVASQSALGSAVELTSILSGLEQLDQKAYHDLLADREKLTAGSSSPTGTEWREGLKTEKNNSFHPKADYAFTVHLKEIKHIDDEKRLLFDLLLNGEKLLPGSSTKAERLFTLTKSQAQYLKDNEEKLPGKLSIEVVFHAND